MAIVDETTKLPIATFCRNSGLHPLHAMGVSLESLNSRVGCNGIIPTYEWQYADAVSRNEIARAIRGAESDIEEIVGSKLIPQWVVSERVSLPRPFNPEYSFFGIANQRGYLHGFNAKWGNFIQSGIRTKSLIAATQAITWDAADTYGWKAYGTIGPIATTVTEVSEIAAYYPGTSAADKYEIRPIKVKITGGQLTIRVARELCVLEAEQNGIVSAPTVNGIDDTKFLEEIDVYRVYNDPATSANIIWESIPAGCGYCDGSGSCESCGYYTQSACVTARDYESSLLAWTPADYAAGEWTPASMVIARAPDMLNLWYRSGIGQEAYVDGDGYTELNMANQYMRAVVLLATSRLDRPICGCLADVFAQKQADLAFSGGATELAKYNITKDDLANPFGTKRGAIEAWRIIAKFQTVSRGQGAVLA